MRRMVTLLTFILLSTTPCLAEVPFSVEKGFVIAEATIKGNVAVNVVLATGVEHSLTDPSLMQKYELQGSYAADGPVTGRNDKIIGYTAVSNVKIGDGKAKNLNMRFTSIAELSQRTGKEIFGILGADFFEGQILQFDFKNKVIRFFEKTPDDLIGQKNSNSGSGRITVLRMAPKPTSPFEKTYLMPLIEDVQLNDQKLKLMLDTGTASSLALSSAAAKKVRLAVPDENGPPREEKLTLRFQSQAIDDVSTLIYAKGTGADQKLSKYGAVAGSLFLQNFIALFDYRKGLVVLEQF